MATPRYRPNPLPGAPVTHTHTIVLSYKLVYKPSDWTMNKVRKSLQNRANSAADFLQLAHGGVDVETLVEFD